MPYEKGKERPHVKLNKQLRRIAKECKTWRFAHACATVSILREVGCRAVLTNRQRLPFNMALFDLFTANDHGLASVLPYWRILLLVSIPLSVVYLYLRTARPRDVDIRQFSHFPQPEEADPKRGHWPWLEKIGGEGDPRRAFGNVKPFRRGWHDERV